MSIDSFSLPKRGKNRGSDLKRFAEYLLTLQKRVKFKLSSRGWCYQMEGFNVIDKSQFNRVQKIINECRKKGLLPIDFVAEDKGREIQNIYKPTLKTPKQRIVDGLNDVLTTGNIHKPDFWGFQPFYLQLIVEKVDLVSLFLPICKIFKIPIANAKGWSSILLRAKFAERFQDHEQKGCIPILLYYGDHDPFGLIMSERIVKNFQDIAAGTGWEPPANLVNRFGLNYDFIKKYDLTWIDNLISGTGKKPDYKNPIVKKYIAKYGERKVEANAVVTQAIPVQNQLVQTILQYLGDDVIDAFTEKKREIVEEYEAIIKEFDLTNPIEDAIDRIRKSD